MNLISPLHWKEYELLDTGDGEKLERFGAYVLRRPEPQAVWKKDLSGKEWEKLADARFVQAGSHSGTWETRSSLPARWDITYTRPGWRLTFKLARTSFKHVGLFPEQAANWDFIYDNCKVLENPRVLNLFAYTGGASLAARAAGASVVHCDSIKQVVTWANDNMKASDLDSIQWLVEDAFTFVKREAKRGNMYDGIILDPPAYGHGPRGEKWKLEDSIDGLTAEIARILKPSRSFLVFNSYSLGFSPLVLQNLLHTHLGQRRTASAEACELCIPERSGRKLPLGVVCRLPVSS